MAQLGCTLEKCKFENPTPIEIEMSALFTERKNFQLKCIVIENIYFIQIKFKRVLLRISK